MKENLKQDICRISEIMRVSNILIVESSGPGDDFIKFINYLSYKIGDTKLGNAARDILKNKVDDLQILNKITKEESQKLKRIFDADDFETLARKSNTVDDFVDNLGKNYDRDIIRKVVNQIPETQIKEMTLDLVNDIIEKNEKALEIYELLSNRTISELGEKLLTDPNFTNKSLDEIYDYIKLADTQGNFKDYPLFLDNFRSRFKNDPKLEKFLKKHPELLNDEEKAKFIDDTPKLADGILDNTKDKTRIEKMVRDFKNFYINNLEPYTRWYLDWIRNVFFKFKLSPEATANKAINEFNEKMKMGFDAFRAKGPREGQNINNAYARQVLNDLAKLPTRLNNNINPNLSDKKNLQGLLWDEYKKNAKKQLGENSDEYIKLSDYMSYVEQKKFKYDKTLCWKELCGLDDSLKVLELDILEQVSALQKNLKVSNQVKTYLDSVKKKFHNLLSIFFSGNFKTPADYTRFVMKNTPKSQQRALNNLITVEGFGTKRVITFMAQSYLLSSVLIPAMISIVVQIIDLIRESFGDKETRYYVKDREYSNYFALNIIINAFIDGVLNTSVLDLLGSSKELVPWYDGFIKELPLPGSFDKVLIYLAIRGQKLSESIRGKPSDTEKKKDDLKKIKNKTNTLKKIIELSKLPKNELHKYTIGYLTRVNAKYVIPNQKLRTLYIKLLKSEGEKVFLINSIDNKKYELIKNVNWNRSSIAKEALELNSNRVVYNGKNGPELITALDSIFEPLIELSEPTPVEPPIVSDKLKKVTSNTNENVLDYLVFKIKKQLIYEQYERKIRRG